MTLSRGRKAIFVTGAALGIGGLSDSTRFMSKFLPELCAAGSPKA